MYSICSINEKGNVNYFSENNKKISSRNTKQYAVLNFRISTVRDKRLFFPKFRLPKITCRKLTAPPVYIFGFPAAQVKSHYSDSAVRLLLNPSNISRIHSGILEFSTKIQERCTFGEILAKDVITLTQ